MNYNFDLENDRRGTNSYKWDSRPDVPADTIPLWVADMDFKTAPPIIDALRRRVEQGIFGYTYVPDKYYESLDRWFTTYHGWHIPREQVIYTTGVVPAISAIIKTLTNPDEYVLLLTPVYNCFYSSIRNNECQPLESPLVLKGDRYEIDFEDFEAKASDPDCTVFLLCNPHNPAGRVWTADELRRLGDICHRHHVTVITDEIHCELVFSPYKYTPYACVAPDQFWVACVSPSKAFNIAGLQIANIVAPREEMRSRIDRSININEVCDVNPFGVVGLMAAYDESRPWLESLLPYIYGNYQLLKQRFAEALPWLPVIVLEGTYLAWIDCRAINMSSVDLEEYLIEKAHVWLNAGSMYGEAGEGFMRVNLACPRARLAEAIDRLIPVLGTMKK